MEYLAEEGENDRKNDSRFIAYIRSDDCGIPLPISPLNGSSLNGSSLNGSPLNGSPLNGYIAGD